MQVNLIDYTGYGTINPSRRAANLLIFTKSTRLQMNPSLMSDIESWDEDKIETELKYMADSIPSSWEFVSLTFLIEDVTRAFTHQLVRTRTASFAQQTMRVLDVSQGSGWKYGAGPTTENNKTYIETMKIIADSYKQMIAEGVNKEDARGILPTNILTNIVMKIDMRNFISMAHKRTSFRVQSEYRKIIGLMLIEVSKVYKWFYIFYRVNSAQAQTELSRMIQDNKSLSIQEKIDFYKKLDIIKGEM